MKQYVYLKEMNPRNRLQIFYLGCNTGSYGVNCSKTCGHCNNSETCDIDTGECDDNGCALPGLRPPICDGKSGKVLLCIHQKSVN